MHQLTLHFNTGYQLAICLKSSEFVSRWTQLLTKEIQKDSILQIDTFSFCMTAGESRSQLTSAVQAVNNFLKTNFIRVPDDDEWNDQQYYNYLHERFEQLSGPSWDQPTRLLKIAPDSVRLAIRHINRFCHRLEQRPYQLLPYMRVEFDTIDRVTLEPDDYKLFVHTNDANCVYLDFSMLGKSLQECYQDGLSPDYAGATLQTHYSANFVVRFEAEPEDAGFKSWLNSHKISMDTPGLGHIPLGHIVDHNARQSIEKCSKISKITLE